MVHIWLYISKFLHNNFLQGGSSVELNINLVSTIILKVEKAPEKLLFENNFNCDLHKAFVFLWFAKNYTMKYHAFWYITMPIYNQFPVHPVHTISPMKMHVGLVLLHDDVIKWKHFPRYWPFLREIHRSPVNSSHKGQCRGALMFSLLCAWMSAWANNR